MTESLKRKISAIGAQSTSILSVALVLLLIGIVMAVTIITADTGAQMRRQAGMIVKMYPNAPQADIDQLRDMLEGLPYFSDVDFMSAEAVLAEERTYHRELLGLLGQNPFAAEFEVHLTGAYSSADSIAKIIGTLQFLPTVEDVYALPDMTETLYATIRQVNRYIIFLVVIMILISVSLIYNTVSMSVYSRRFIINTMQLIGATTAYIRMPYLKAAARNGLIAAGAAIVIFLLLRMLSATFEYDLMFVITITDYLLIFIVMGVLGAAISVGAAYLAIERYIDSQYEELYA